ncbi:MAG TPA: flagellar basal body-associated FliL family protein [Roseiarcus sp.]|nr:flagellar basal body-associated FliL family protein [Roseiarcus sp.]
MAEPDPPAGLKKKSSFMSKLIEFLLVTLIAAGAGVGLTAMNPPALAPDPSAADKPPPGKLAPKKKPGEKAQTALACGPGGPNMIDMPPIVTNIASPSDVWIRLEASLVFDAKTLQHPEVVAAEIATDELAFLHTVSINELQGPIGLENIRQDLRDRAFVRSGGKVSDLLIKTLVLQ